MAKRFFDILAITHVDHETPKAISTASSNHMYNVVQPNRMSICRDHSVFQIIVIVRLAMLKVVVYNSISIFGVNVVKPKPILVPGITWISEYLGGLGPNVSELPGARVRFPGNESYALGQLPKAFLALTKGFIIPCPLDGQTGQESGSFNDANFVNRWLTRDPVIARERAEYVPRRTKYWLRPTCSEVV